MYRFETNSATTFSTLSALLVLLAILALLTPGAAAALGPCDDAMPLPLQEISRGAGGAAGESRLLELDLPAPGLLALEVAVPGTATAEPRLDFLGRDCARWRVDSKWSYLRRSAAGVVVRIETPGTYFARVTTQDPRLVLGRYKVSAWLVEGTGRDPEPDWAIEEMEIEPDVRQGTEEMEIEPDVRQGTEEMEIEPDVRQGTEEMEIEPDVRQGTEEMEIEPDVRQGTEEMEIEPDWAIEEMEIEPDVRLCAGGGDDHADVASCPTPLPLGRPVAGELGNGWGDDDDYFVFVLESMRTVVVTTRGEADTLGGLYDQRGNRLALDDDGGDGANFRIVKTLGPGRYRVRVEGAHGATGPYSLVVDTIWQNDRKQDRLLLDLPTR